MSFARSLEIALRRASAALIAAGAVVVGVMLVVALVWLPLERTRARLDAELPQLRASIDALKRDADEVKRLRAVAPTVPANPTPLAPLWRRTMGARARRACSSRVPDEKHVHLVAADVRFTALLDWLVTVQVDARACASKPRASRRSPCTGRVRAELVPREVLTVARARPRVLGHRRLRRFPRRHDAGELSGVAHRQRSGLGVVAARRAARHALERRARGATVLAPGGVFALDQIQWRFAPAELAAGRVAFDVAASGPRARRERSLGRGFSDGSSRAPMRELDASVAASWRRSLGHGIPKASSRSPRRSGA